MSHDHNPAGILSSFADSAEPDATLDRLCRICAEQLGVSGAAIALVVTGCDPGSIADSGELASLIVDLQFNLGEGPTIDAHQTGMPMLVADLTSSTRWPAFGTEAVEAGAAAVFALPLRIGAARFGALTMYHDRSGPLADGVLADGLIMAELAAEITLCLQAEVPPGSLHQVVEALAARRTVVYQATGMVLVQLAVGPEDALAALRARAYTDGQPVGEVAADVVARRLGFRGNETDPDVVRHPCAAPAMSSE